MHPTGPPLGILMLDTAFHRPVGDVGHPETWPFPVLFETVPGAAARHVVDGNSDGNGDALLAPFAAAARRLVGRGAVALTTSCGFLARLQPALAAAVPVPVATSALLQVASVAAALPPGRRPGVLTYDAASLDVRLLQTAGVPAGTPVAGLPRSGVLHGVIERGAPYDAPGLEAEVCAAAAGLLARHGEVGAIVLECTNLPPFAPALRRRFRLPVFDIVTLGCALHAASSPQMASWRVTSTNFSGGR